MVELLSAERDGMRVLTTIHWCFVRLRSLCYAGAPSEEIAQRLTQDDARLNELLAGRLGSVDFLRSAEAAYRSTVHDVPSLSSGTTWVGREYSSGPAVALAHAARAFLKAVAWEADGGAPPSTLATYFDAFEHISLVLMGDGPEKAAGLLSSYSDTMAPFVSRRPVIPS
ncbi:MAG: hypothetical protein V4850_31335 [Myxococcota bacterium]